MDPRTPELTVLSNMITPAVLVSACGTLLLSTSNRLLRVIDRVHDWSDQLESLSREQPSDPLEREKRALLYTQLDETARRAHLLQWSMTIYYLAVGVFVTDIVVIGLSALRWIEAPWVTIALGLLGVGLLLAGSVVLIAEARIALNTTEREMEYLRQLGRQRVPAELRRRRGWAVPLRPTPWGRAWPRRFR